MFGILESIELGPLWSKGNKILNVGKQSQNISLS